MSTLTIHSPDPEIERQVREKSRRENRSLNRVLQELIAKGLGDGVGGDDERRAKFGKYLGIWSEKDGEEFDGAVGDFERVDPEDWQ